MKGYWHISSGRTSFFCAEDSSPIDLSVVRSQFPAYVELHTSQFSEKLRSNAVWSHVDLLSRIANYNYDLCPFRCLNSVYENIYLIKDFRKKKSVNLLLGKGNKWKTVNLPDDRVLDLYIIRQKKS